MSQDRKLNFPDFQRWLADAEIVYASEFGNGKHKRLICSLSGGFRVEVHGKVVHTGLQPYPAVEAYNEHDGLADPTKQT